MSTGALLAAGLANAAMATGIAILAFAVSRRSRRPEIAPLLWLLVLAKLVTPPISTVEIAALDKEEDASDLPVTERRVAARPRPRAQAARPDPEAAVPEGRRRPGRGPASTPAESACAENRPLGSNGIDASPAATRASYGLSLNGRWSMQADCFRRSSSCRATRRRCPRERAASAACHSFEGGSR